MCKLCNGTFDFRKVQISEVFGELTITFTPYLNNTNAGTRFKYCPMCGRKLTKKDFAANVCKNKNCLSCSNSFSEERPDGDVLHCMCRNGVVVPDNGYCAEYN